MTHFKTLAFGFTTAACLGAPTAQAEDILSILQRQAQTQQPLPPKAIPYTYTITLDVTEIEGDDISSGQAVLRIDPSQPAGSRAKLISANDPEGEALTEFLTELEKPGNTIEKMAEDFWCESTEPDENEFDPSTFVVVSETDEQAVLRPQPGQLTEMLMQSDDEEEMDKQERKMVKKLLDRIDGELILSKPDARMTGFKVWMTRPMKIMVVAKIKSMDIEQSCKLSPNGHYYASTLQFSLSGKALGTEFGQDMNIRITDLAPRP